MTDLIPIITLGFFVLLAILVFSVLRSKKRSKQKTSKNYKLKKGFLDSDNPEEYLSKHDKKNTTQNLFSAVSIAHDLDNACEEIKALGNVRFLTKEAPLIPLRSCSKRDSCNCRYVHHTDRRTGPRRNSFSTITADAMDTDRRQRESKKGRRYTDK